MKIKPIKIGKKLVYPGNAYIIAEIGSNFDESYSKAKKLIKKAKECGADAVKFQLFVTEELLSKKGFKKKSAFQSKWKESVYDTYRKAELPRKWLKGLKEYADKMKIDFFTSPWDLEAVDIMEKINVPAYKIGSGDITYHQILRKIASKEKPIFLATGASNLKEVSEAIKVIKKTGNQKILLLHSVVQYPSPISDANLKSLEILREKFGLNVGYSDHSPGSLIPLASIALGACVIEKHFSLNPKSKGPDHPHSMDTISFKKMVKDIRTLESAIGKKVKKPASSESETRIIQRRGIWTTREIKKGEKFNIQNIKPLRPALKISASKFEQILGKKAKRNFKSFEAIGEEDI